MPSKDVLVGLDVGERRIGVALGDSIGRLAAPLTTLAVDDTLPVALGKMLQEHDATRLVVGLPRNMSGQETRQTQAVREFVDTLASLQVPVDFQDESVTSVLAEEQLLKRKKPYTKADIDAMAAAIILQDYLEEHYG